MEVFKDTISIKLLFVVEDAELDFCKLHLSSEDILVKLASKSIFLKTLFYYNFSRVYVA